MKQSQIEHREEERKIAETLYHNNKVFIPLLQAGKYNVRRIIKHLVEMSIEVNVTKYEDIVFSEKVNYKGYMCTQSCLFKMNFPRIIRGNKITNGGVYLRESEHYRRHTNSFMSAIYATFDYGYPRFNSNIVNYFYEAPTKSEHYIKCINRFLKRFTKKLIAHITEFLYQDFKRIYLS